MDHNNIHWYASQKLVLKYFCPFEYVLNKILYFRNLQLTSFQHGYFFHITMEEPTKLSPYLNNHRP